MTMLLRAINLYCDLMAGSVLDGLQAEMRSSGIDLGESSTLPENDLFPQIGESERGSSEP